MNWLYYGSNNKILPGDFYTFNAAIIVNRLVPFTEEIVFRLGARLRGMSQVFNRKSNQVPYYGVKYKSQFKYFYDDILSGFYIMIYNHLYLSLSHDL